MKAANDCLGTPAPGGQHSAPVRILCVSPFFPPYQGAESFCGGKMVLALRQAGIDVTVLSMESAFPRAGTDDSALWRELEPVSVPIEVPKKVQRVRGALCALKYRTLLCGRWIDDLIQRVTRLHQAQAFHLVYSRSLPMFAHVAGYWVSRKLRLPWIANVNDPWDLHLFPDRRGASVSLLYAKFSEFWLRRTLTQADAVTFPSSRLAAFTTKSAQPASNVHIIPHVGAAKPSQGRSGAFELLHAGKLGVNEITGRSTRTILVGLRKFLNRNPSAAADTRLVLLGPEDAASQAVIEQLHLREIVDRPGAVTYEESLEHIAGASVCLLIEARMEEGLYLPSKFVDYLAAKKPVLALSPQVGTIADLPADPSLIRVDDGDEDATARAIGFYYSHYRQGTLGNLVPAPELTMPFTPEAVASKFLSLASQLSGCPRTVSQQLLAASLLSLPVAAAVQLPSL